MGWFLLKCLSFFETPSIQGSCYILKVLSNFVAFIYLKAAGQEVGQSEVEGIKTRRIVASAYDEFTLPLRHINTPTGIQWPFVIKINGSFSRKMIQKF